MKGPPPHKSGAYDSEQGEGISGVNGANGVNGVNGVRGVRGVTSESQLHEGEDEDHQEAETLTPSIKWPVRQRKGWPQRADKAELTLNMPGFHSALKRYIQSRPASGVDGAPGRRTEENPLVWVYNCITVRYPAWSRDELGGESSVGNVEH